MNLKDYLKNNYIYLNGNYELIKVLDIDYIQGVIIILQSDIETILNDRPVKKYLNYEVIEENKDNNIIILSVRK